MSQNNTLVIAVAITLVVGIGAGIGICYFFTQGGVTPYVINSAQDDSVKKAEAEATKKAAEAALMKERYPDVIRGVIDLTGNRGKIKSDEGKEYLLWPFATGSYFESIGYQNNQKGEFQGKILLKDTLFNADRFAIMPQIK